MTKAYAAPGKQWVYTAAGVERSKASPYAYQPSLGQPLPEHYRECCPSLWVEQGWVEESDATHD